MNYWSHHFGIGRITVVRFKNISFRICELSAKQNTHNSSVIFHDFDDWIVPYRILHRKVMERNHQTTFKIRNSFLLIYKFIYSYSYLKNTSMFSFLSYYDSIPNQTKSSFTQNIFVELKIVLQASRFSGIYCFLAAGACKPYFCFILPDQCRYSWESTMWAGCSAVHCWLGCFCDPLNCLGSLSLNKRNDMRTECRSKVHRSHSKFNCRWMRISIRRADLAKCVVDFYLNENTHFKNLAISSRKLINSLSWQNN